MGVLSKAQIASLSTQERLALIDDLLESLETPHLESSIEAAHRQIVEERLADYHPESETLLTVDEVCQQLQAR
jgi:putative addiction module component (TIGR02574 family)